jgi:2-furoyl-CoA dehydrogenase FAD binding subunit
MKPPAFDYVRAGTVDEITAALAEHGNEARVIAGGQSLIAMLNMRLARPALLVDLMRVEPLSRIVEEPYDLVIGAAVRQSATLSYPGLKQQTPLLVEALPWVGHVQTRSRGTICGSVAHADPSAEIPLCLIALQGEVRLRTHRKRRRVPAEAFFTGMMATNREDDEFIEAVAFPKRRAGTGYAFVEVGRRHGDFAIVACAAVVDAKRMRLAVSGIADRPTARDFPLLEGSALDDALNAFAWELRGSDDIHATARYRRDLVRKLGRKALLEALSCRS